MNTSLAQATDNREVFDTAMPVGARFAGGTIMLDAEHVDWLGETMVKLDIPGLTSPLMLRTFEARDLAHALLALAAHIDEDTQSVAVAA